MEIYQNTSESSSSNSSEATPPAPSVGGGGPLVNTFISHSGGIWRNPVKGLLVYPRAVKLLRDFAGSPPKHGEIIRGEITGFSESSRRRLRFNALNCSPKLISQFGMTYHHDKPDGRTVKKHLNLFLNSLRKYYPGVGYLWLLEFQSRGVAHVHLFLTLPTDRPGLHSFLAETWNRIVDPANKKHLRVHQHEKNFIPWVMDSAAYLCKYLDKEAQKAVPAGFTGVGRFWGNSRGLVPQPEFVDMEEVSETFTPYVTRYMIRTLCKHNEKALKRSKWKSSARTRLTSYTLQNGAIIALKLFDHLSKYPPPLEPVPF